MDNAAVVAAFIFCCFVGLISFEMPVYLSRLLGYEAYLHYIWTVAWNDSIPTRILFVAAYMVVGFLIWAGPLGAIVYVLHPVYGHDIRAMLFAPLLLLWKLTAGFRLMMGTKIDAWYGGLKERHELKKLYHTDFKGQFLSFSHFHKYYRWLNDNNQTDMTAPIRDSFAASSDKFKDAEILLGLPKSYGAQDLSDRYKALLKQVHPDIIGPNDIVRRVTDARNLIKARKGWR